MVLPKENQEKIEKLITNLDRERAWLLEQIDLGKWPELRLDLAALERELGQLLIRASEFIDCED